MNEISLTQRNLLALVACLLWSTAFIGIKAGLQYTTPFQFAGYRFMISGLILLPFSYKSIRLFKSRPALILRILLISFFNTFMLYAAFYYGITILSGALTAITVGSGPIITALLTHLYIRGDKMTMRKLVSLMCGFAGITIISISRKPWQAAGLQQVIGIAIIVSGNLFSSIGNILVAKRTADVPPLLLTSMQIFLGGFGLFILSVFVEGRPVILYPLPYYPALFWLAFISAAAFGIWFSLLKIPGTRVSELNIWKFIIPVGGALLSWLVLPDESPDAGTISGMIFVGIGIIALNYSIAKEKAPAPT
ncbi:MAG: EamA family transporter [Chitinivibrionales bacterium]|nr:EamA family transporter [Chitinivibrionales bacterium]